MAEVPPPALYLHAGDDMRRVTIGEAEGGREVTVPQTFTAAFDLPPAGMVRMRVETGQGRARIAEVEVTEPEGAGVTGVTIASIPVARLLESAVTYMAVMGSGAGIPASREAAGRASRRRRPVDDDRLQEVAAAHAYGGIEAVRDSQHVSERQAYRLLRQAREAGFAPKEDHDG
jgi:hypothetical protein